MIASLMFGHRGNSFSGWLVPGSFRTFARCLQGYGSNYFPLMNVLLASRLFPTFLWSTGHSENWGFDWDALVLLLVQKVLRGSWLGDLALLLRVMPLAKFGFRKKYPSPTHREIGKDCRFFCFSMQFGYSRLPRIFWAGIKLFLLCHCNAWHWQFSSPLFLTCSCWLRFCSL